MNNAEIETVLTNSKSIIEGIEKQILTNQLTNILVTGNEIVGGINKNTSTHINNNNNINSTNNILELTIGATGTYSITIPGKNAITGNLSGDNLKKVIELSKQIKGGKKMKKI